MSFMCARIIVKGCAYSIENACYERCARCIVPMDKVNTTIKVEVKRLDLNIEVKIFKGTIIVKGCFFLLGLGSFSS